MVHVANEFRSYPAAYAWCLLRRILRPVLRQNEGLMVCVILNDPTLAGFLENACELLLAGRERHSKGLLESDFATLKVRTGRSETVNLLGDLSFRKTVSFFRDEHDIPDALRCSADIIATIGPPDPNIVRAAVYLFKGTAIGFEDAIFLASLPVTDVAIALRRGVPVTRGIARLKLASSGAEAVAVKPYMPPELPDGGTDPGLAGLDGYGSAVEWGIQFCRNVESFRDGSIQWSAVGRGLLLYGPPGTGKSKFAAHVARAAGMSLHSHSYSSWTAEGAQSDMLRAMRSAFRDAARSSPCILLIDEIDSFSVREHGGRNDKYMRGVVNGLLECLDGSERKEGVFVIATTNDITAVDPAILRSGRVEQHIELQHPDAVARVGILAAYLGIEIQDSDAESVAAATQGKTGSDLELLSRQVIAKTHAAGEKLTVAHLFEELPKSVALPPERLWANALHETGHAIIGLAVGRHVVGVQLSESIREGQNLQSLGSVTFEEQSLTRRTKADLQDDLLVFFGGMAAEIEVFGNYDIGASGDVSADLNQATAIATRIEVMHGMGHTLIAETGDDRDLSRMRQLYPSVRQKVEATLADALSSASEIMKANEKLLVELAGELMRAKSLSGHEVDNFLATRSLSIVPRVTAIERTSMRDVS